MISIGLIKWTMEQLSDVDKMSDYVLRYSLALFMNLCLRKEGEIEYVVTYNYMYSCPSQVSNSVSHFSLFHFMYSVTS